MNRRLVGSMVTLLLLGGGSAHPAGRPPANNLPDPRKEQSNTWRETTAPVEYEFPWLQVGFFFLVTAAASPFAWRAYLRQSKELREANAFGTNSVRRKPRPAVPPERR